MNRNGTIRLCFYICSGLVFVYASSHGYAGYAQVDETIPILCRDDFSDWSAADCGVLAMGMALVSQGESLSVTAFLNKEFVSSPLGSTPNQLMKMAEFVGVKTHFMESLSWFDIRDSESPVLLLLRERDSPDYVGHWVAFLGVKGENAIFFDSAKNGNHKTFEIPPADLLVKWQGQAIVFESIDSEWRWRLTSLRILLPIALSAFLAGLLARLSRRNPTYVVGMLTVAATVWFGTRDNILLNQDTRIHQFLESKYSKKMFPITKVADAVSRFDSGFLHLVDARRQVDFSERNLDHSVNLHVNLTMQELAELVNTWGKHDPIVVYCVGEHCGWSLVMARRLEAIGFDNIFLSRESIQTIFNENN